jgi:putative ABC transport system permease protein
MKTSLKKSIRDLISYPKKTMLVIFALALGIWGVGTVLVSYVILSNDLNQNYQNTVPSNITFHSQNFNLLNLDEFKKDSRIQSAEFRDFSLHRIEVRPNVWIPLWLFGIEDFNKISTAKIFHQTGANVPKPGTILIERDGIIISNIRIDSIPRVRIANKILKLPVSGICFDPGQAPATQDAFIYAYTDKITYQQITGLPVNQRLIVRLNNVQSKHDVETISNTLIAEMKSKGIEIQSIDIPPFNQHPHQWQLNTLLYLIGAIGFLAFIMGAVLVSQLMRSIMTNQIRQIGILKSIGATRFQILRMYFFMLMAIGIVSGIIAIPLAISTGKVFSYFVAGKLNFNILTLIIPIKVYLYLISASILLPVLLSFSMLLKGTAISVNNALTEYGISQRMTTFQFSFLKQRWLSYSMQLAFRNSLRNTKRLTVTILTMALGVAIFNTGFNVRQSLWELLSGLKNEMRYDVAVALNKPLSKEEALKQFKNLDNVKEVEMWVGGRGEIQSKIISTNNGAGIVAVPKSTELLKLKIRSGRWLAASNDFEIVLNQQAWELYKNPSIGSFVNLTIRNKQIKARLVGIAEQFEKPKIYADIQHYDSLFNPEHKINTLIFAAENNDFNNVVDLKKSIEKAIAPSDLDVLYVMSQAERVKIVYDHLNIILSTIVLLSFLVLIVSSVGMASATGINIWERAREIGVMRAVGATPKIIYNLLVSEGMIISVLSILLGLLLAYPLSKIAAIFFGNLMLGKGSNLQYAFSSLGFGITVIVTIIFGWLASRFPAKSAIDISTREALSYE